MIKPKKIGLKSILSPLKKAVTPISCRPDNRFQEHKATIRPGTDINPY